MTYVEAEEWKRLRIEAAYIRTLIRRVKEDATLALEHTRQLSVGLNALDLKKEQRRLKRLYALCRELQEKLDEMRVNADAEFKRRVEKVAK